jgi:toluene monooxygenase system ferredoxin subunit
MAWKKIAGAETVESGTMKQLPTEDGQEVLVLNGEGTYFACQAVCPHLDTPLEEGMFDGQTLTCHQHLWQWNVATGDPQGLAESPLQCFRLKTENGNVYLWQDD